jgi:penicillin-binding protein-related factor A (putative recombinase)
MVMSTFHLDRKNASNDGLGFEHEMEFTFAAYARARVATARKVSPPARIVGSFSARKVIFMPNPFLDFAGAWTKHAGRALFLEAKSTGNGRLPFQRDAGIKVSQLEALLQWADAGAAVGVIWHRTDIRKTAMLTLFELCRAKGQDAASVPWEDARPVPQGRGGVIHDVLAVLEAEYYPPAPSGRVTLVPA